MRLSLPTAVGLFLFATAFARAQVAYTITDLGTLAGGNVSYGYAINETGQVAGRSGIAGSQERGFFYSAGTMTNVGVLGASTQSQAWGINNAGTVVGASPAASGRGFSWNNGVRTDLGSVNPYLPYSYANDINNTGQIVGNYTNAAFATAAGLYSGGAWSDLGNIGYGYTLARAINDSGTVVGTGAINSSLTLHAFRYTAGGGIVDLGTMGGTGGSEAWDVNLSGQIVGISTNASGYSHAFVNTNGVWTDIGLLFSQQNAVSYAYGINDAGTVVGNAAGVAFLYSSGTVFNLNNLIDPGLGWTLQEARDINNAGQIVGTGLNSLGQTRAFLLTPTAIPEPSTYAALAGLGALGLAALRRRSRA